MSRRTTFLPILLSLAATLTATLSPPAAAHSRKPYSMEVLVDGVPLATHHARGKTYVEAVEAREYAIRLTNHTAQRVAVALAVDGLNSIDAKTGSAREASKWILGPWQTITIDGWQTGPTTARRFFFTTEDESYGAWLGKTKNLGVVAAAFFRERQPRPVPYLEGDSDRRRAPAKSGDAPRAEAEAPSDDHAATGMGREIGHHVRRVAFDAEPTPASLIELRYEYRDALIGLGVLPRDVHPLDRREDARGFEPGDFAPVAPR